MLGVIFVRMFASRYSFAHPLIKNTPNSSCIYTSLIISPSSCIKNNPLCFLSFNSHPILLNVVTLNLSPPSHPGLTSTFSNANSNSSDRLYFTSFPLTTPTTLEEFSRRPKTSSLSRPNPATGSP
jgi:hypothetical protein